MITASSIVALLVILAIIGVAAWLLSIAPFIAEPFKGFINWILIVVAVIVVVVFALGLLGVGTGITLK